MNPKYIYFFGNSSQNLFSYSHLQWWFMKHWMNSGRKKYAVLSFCVCRWHTLLKMFSFCENEKTCVNRRKQRWFFFIASSSDCCCVILKGIVLFPILQPTTDAEERVETQYCMYYLNICQNNYKRWQMKIN